MEAEPSSVLRFLPAVHRLIATPEAQRLASHLPSEALRSVVQEIVSALRQGLLDHTLVADRESLEREARARLEAVFKRFSRGGVRRVVNATGVVLHTNLGRAPLGPDVLQAIADASLGYTTLEYDLEKGTRGHRDRVVSEALSRLTGAQDALVVNNCAAAVLLVASALAQGREVLVSRGELVEIGGGFRVPEILESCGATLREVGTTNRTHPKDYANALRPTTAMILKVHRSNFRLEGFVRDVTVRELRALQRSSSQFPPIVCDLGSGVLDGDHCKQLGLSDEPDVKSALEEGADLVMFSGDKLFGSVQAGLVVGRKDLIATLRRHPLARALRPGRLVLAALDATLRAYLSGHARSALPVFSMLSRPAEELRDEALKLASALQQTDAVRSLDVSVQPSQARVGGGSSPGVEIESWALALRPKTMSTHALERALRVNTDVPVIARVDERTVQLDMRTMDVREHAWVIASVLQAVQSANGTFVGRETIDSNDETELDHAVPSDGDDGDAQTTRNGP